MHIERIVTEMIAVLAESGACLYFLHSRYTSKSYAVWQPLLAWFALISWGLFTTFSAQSVYAPITYVILFFYLFLFKLGSVPRKLLGVLAVSVLHIVLLLLGAGLTASMRSYAIEHTLEYQDTSRLLVILFIKTLEVVIFYLLSKKSYSFRNIKKPSGIVIVAAIIADFAILFGLRIYVESPDLYARENQLLVWLVVGALLIIVVIFLLYEFLAREEAKSVGLAVQLQRFELEANFFKEIDAMYSDMRKWRHDYKNNLSALRALIMNGDIDNSISYINNIESEPFKSEITLQTGNLVLDSIASSKLWLADSLGIAVTIKAVYPESLKIEDNDLCAIIGNLLDNAIEACRHINEATEKKFINFTLTPKGKNLSISVVNSCNSDKLNQSDNRYLTIKKEPFHGIGIPRIDSIVAKYGGNVLRGNNQGVFETHILLPIEERFL